MQTNSVHLALMCGILICIVSCKKNSGAPFGPTEETTVISFIGSSGNSQPRERPFKGRIVGSFVSTPTSDLAIYSSIANASGNVTHLGVFNKVTNDVINIVSSIVEGTFVMASQNGEQITGMYKGSFLFGTIPGTFSWKLNATITGGTGRFTRAIGEFVFLANGDYVIEEGIVKGNYTETFDGIINY